MQKRSARNKYLLSREGDKIPFLEVAWGGRKDGIQTLGLN
jgi:hypothetical protein